MDVKELKANDINLIQQRESRINPEKVITSNINSSIHIMSDLNPSKLKDHELNIKIKNLTHEERKLTQTILDHIAEVDRRKLYLKLAFPSLFEYLTKEIGYSAGAAQRRIDAARLIQKFPEVGQKIENGSLNLAQISKTQQTFRQVKKESGVAVPLDAQKRVIEKLENLNTQDTELILAQEFQLEVKTKAKTYTQRDESVRVEMTFTKDEMNLMRQAEAVLSNKTGGGLKETVLELAKHALHTKNSGFTKASGVLCQKASAPVNGRKTGMLTTTAAMNELDADKSTATVAVVTHFLAESLNCTQDFNKKISASFSL